MPEPTALSGIIVKTAPPCENSCAAYVRETMASWGCAVNISHIRPEFDTGYEQLDMKCPHGVSWWMEPTVEQIAEWVRDGTE